jgi:hypothetical protein
MLPYFLYLILQSFQYMNCRLTASSDRMIDEYSHKGFGRKQSCLMEVLSRNVPGGIEEHHERIAVVLAPPEYKSAVLPRDKLFGAAVSLSGAAVTG